MRNSRSKSAGDTSTIEKTVARFSYVGKAILKFRTEWGRGGKKDDFLADLSRLKGGEPARVLSSSSRLLQKPMTRAGHT